MRAHPIFLYVAVLFTAWYVLQADENKSPVQTSAAIAPATEGEKSQDDLKETIEKLTRLRDRITDFLKDHKDAGVPSNLITQLTRNIQILGTQEHSPLQKLGVLEENTHIMNSLPEEFLSEWTSLKTETEKALKKQIEQQAFSDLDAAKQLIQKIRKACLSAKNSAELEPLLLEISNFQKQPSGRQQPYQSRTQSMLHSATSVTNSIIQYLDQKNAGYGPWALQTLNTLKNTQQAYPILSTEDIDTLQKTIDLPPTNDIFSNLFAGVKSPDDLSTLLTRIHKAMAEDPDGPSRYSNLIWSLETMNKIWQLVQDGRVEDAMRNYQVPPSPGISSNVNYQMENLRKQVISGIVMARLKKLTDAQFPDDIDLKEAVDQTMQNLYEIKDYHNLHQVILLHNQYLNTPPYKSIPMPPVGNYLTALQYEQAGDVPSAVALYRNILLKQDTKYAPIQEATEALQRLQKSHPDLFKDTSQPILRQLHINQENMLSMLMEMKFQLQNMAVGSRYTPPSTR